MFRGAATKPSRRLEAWLCAAITLTLAKAAMAQDTICSYTWNSNTACNVHIPCVTTEEFSNQTFVVPSNVTRIGRTGLRICLADTGFNNPADIVYVVDI